MTAVGPLKVTDRDGDTLTLSPYSGLRGGVAYASIGERKYDGVYLTEADLRTLRAWIDEQIGTFSKGEPEKPVTKTPTGAVDWSALGYFAMQPEPERLLFGIPEAAVQGLVEAAVEAATVDLKTRERMA